ncbi:hypothetical protein BMS3Abin04_02783 [bacterium BMS3Abin04]|nr:hypothetical protein BMS3Abin04_02783 [bacterium BMS3Abin04]
MKEYKLSEIYIYPVKSLAGISLNSAFVEMEGLRFDRRWMVVDKNNIFLTQRTNPQMVLINTEIKKDRLELSHKTKKMPKLFIPFAMHSQETATVKIFNDEVQASFVSDETDQWLSSTIGTKCRLVVLSDNNKRYVNKKYAHNNETVSFADGFPFLIMGQSSLDLLNSKLEEKLPTNRFRPNFVFTGGHAHDEDNWKIIKIGKTIFDVVKPCARCVITTVDQNCGVKHKEPLLTLSKYRKQGNKILFGQNLIARSLGFVNLEDEIEILEYKRDQDSF